VVGSFKLMERKRFGRKFSARTGRGSQVRSLSRPPSSLRKPHVSMSAPNRAFLRGFSATQFPDFGLCGRSRPGFWSLRAFARLNDDFWRPVSASKNSVPAAVLWDAECPEFAPQFRLLEHCNSGILGGRRKLFRIESECLKPRNSYVWATLILG
jgi:hypothetical protein